MEATGMVHSLPSPPALCPPCHLTFCLTLVQLARVSLQRLWIVTLQAGRWGREDEGRAGGTGGDAPHAGPQNPLATQSSDTRPLPRLHLLSSLPSSLGQEMSERGLGMEGN